MKIAQPLHLYLVQKRALEEFMYEVGGRRHANYVHYSIDASLTWDDTRAGEEFWAEHYYLFEVWKVRYNENT